VHLMGGELLVESQAGQGCCFTVALPAAVVEERPSGAAPTEHPVPHANALGRVLYAEDDPINAELMRQILGTRLRVQLDVARNGAEALAMARKTPPDLLLLDLHLGDMDAVTLSEQLNQDPRFKSIPRLALSADALPEHIQRAMDHGFADYLTKPVDVRALLASIQRHLGQG
jgi:CheY-like chemotaxis protein